MQYMDIMGTGIPIGHDMPVYGAHTVYEHYVPIKRSLSDIQYGAHIWTLCPYMEIIEWCQRSGVRVMSEVSWVREEWEGGRRSGSLLIEWCHMDTFICPYMDIAAALMSGLSVTHGVCWLSDVNMNLMSVDLSVIHALTWVGRFHSKLRATYGRN